MRIPIPRQINLTYMIGFVATLLLVQIIEGTDPLFAGLGAAFLIIWAVSFNACEGLLYPSGAWVFFFGIGTAGVGLFWKAVILEPADKNLLNPDKTMLIYCVGMAAIGLSASFAHRISYKKGLLSDWVQGDQMYAAAIGCFILGTAFALGFASVAEEGSIGSAIRQFNQFNRMAMILGTYYEVKKSGGTRSFNWVVGGAGTVLFCQGLVGFSKEGIFMPFLLYVLPAVTAGVIITKKQLIGGLLVGFFLVFYMVPYSQYGRQSRTEIYDFNSGVQIVEQYLFHLEETREAFNEIDNSVDLTGVMHYYDRPQGLADREQMLAPDDALIDVTDTVGQFGIYPTVFAYLNFIPHFIWPGKPILSFGNSYGHEIGVLADDDDSTGISFSPVGDVYHQAGWLGVTIVLPIVLFLYVFATDSVTGSVLSAPWALLAYALIANGAPEGGVASTIWLTSFGILNIFVIAFLSRYVLPHISKLFTGRKSESFDSTPRFDPPGLTPATDAAGPGATL